MTETNSDIRSPAKREKLRRVALWALLGAASGAIAWVALLAAEVWGLKNDLPILILTMLPGLTFGAAVGLALFGLGHAQIWQAALFAALSVPAWFAGLFVGFEYGVDWVGRLNPDSLYIGFFVIGVVGGAAWAIVQTLAVVSLSFARRVWPLVSLVAVGAVTAGLLLVARPISWPFLFDIWPYLILWTGWYAVYAAVLSLFLPWPNSEARPEEKRAGME